MRKSQAFKASNSWTDKYRNTWRY